MVLDPTMGHGNKTAWSLLRSLNDTMAGPWDTGCIYQGRVMMFPTGLTRMYDPASVICSTVSNATRAAGVQSGWLW
ncbi:hypothetical protein RIB2604_02104410 [Aspergillus luchuensis]|uniref:Uncharacterized protein n=1 Tax=Aspergillus kawachii TaxID=1069201 RepID=A0A146FM61_ASPKA|nr:hypothetical protein RIB2604_02104410 [Aspergillus luchuensis]